MSDDGFRADIPVISKHSNEVQGFASRVDSAKSAAQASLDSNAFGIFGQFLATQAISIAEDMKANIESGGKALASLRQALDDTANEYQQRDQESLQHIQGVHVDFGR
ncbi:type VII secretion target [Saccharopolyspora sp. K220]|uniref:type VII secretion target n=1 Tax=Saccharopolyspora soli TaxID=2926618 RepID=UPI001F5664EB|nr:type VII secretion target [Saccharopolyspora soli]MCI2419161.1 type VII secretion target [Saccharopolyspora soli]